MVPELNDVAVLMRVVALGSFAKVARELKVPTSTVARAVARLEESLDLRMIQRSTRGLTPTSEGRAFYEEVAPAVATIQRVTRSIAAADKTPRGVLRVAATSEIGAWVLAPAIVKLTNLFPLIRVDLELSPRTVNIVEEGYDVAVRLGPLVDSSLVSTKLAEMRADIYASTAYVEKNGAPATLAELEQHPCVLFRARDGVSEWVLEGPAGRVKQTVRGRICSDDYGAVRAAVLEGAGIGRLPRMMTASDVSRGLLVKILPEYDALTRPIHYVHESSRNVAPKIAFFRQILIEDFAQRVLEWRILDKVSAVQRRPAKG